MKRRLPYYIVIFTLFFSLLQPSALFAASGRETGIATGTSLLWADKKELTARLTDIKNLGATWIRVDFNWAEVQRKGYHYFNWAPYDRVVNAAKKHGIKILATLTYTPSWARSKKCLATGIEHRARGCRPRIAYEFGRFARAATIRYKHNGVHVWEIWNEPNLAAYWNVNQLSGLTAAQAYARIANEAAREIRRHNKNAFIITGGLAPMFEPHPVRGVRQSDFLEKALVHLEPHLFNAVGIHPYSWPKMPSKAADYNAFYTVDNGDPEYNLRRIMINAGWGSKQIWATEFGASTKGERNEHNWTLDERPDHVTEAKQARIIAEGLRIWHKKPLAGPIFVYSDSDFWLAQHGLGNEQGFGLRRIDGSKKPAYGAFKNTSQTLH